MTKPFELLPIFRERVWGRRSLEPLFPDELAFRNLPDKPSIGEVWFSFRENPTVFGKQLGDLLEQHPEWLGTGADKTHPGICPILVKLLFTSERLSVQVHPDDTYAQQHHQSLGKTEAWYVVDAEPPGEISAGFRRPLTPDEFKASIESGEIENLLDWRAVTPGEIVFIPAGTVHAIGAGLTICEIQENSDITYRLYDYGRPRELHVEHGARVSQLAPHENAATLVQLGRGRDELAVSDYFRIERLRPERAIAFEQRLPFYAILICLKGSGKLNGGNGAKSETIRAGQAWFVPANADPFAIDTSGSEWILTYRSDRATNVQVK